MIRLTDSQGHWLLGLLETIRPAPSNSTETEAIDLRRIISEQLNTPSHFDDLIDTVARLLADPRIHMLKEAHLESLRRSILSPTELVRFRGASKHTLDCDTCGHGPIHDYESVTLVRGRINCHRCAYPEYVMCHQCRQLVMVNGMNKSIQRAIERHTCVEPQPVDIEEQTEHLEMAVADEQIPTPAPPSWTNEGSVASFAPEIRRGRPAAIRRVDEPFAFENTDEPFQQ